MIRREKEFGNEIKGQKLGYFETHDTLCNKYIVPHINTLTEPILFWNIGC